MEKILRNLQKKPTYLQIRNKVSNIAGHKVNIQHPTVFSYSCDEQTKNEINSFIYKIIRKFRI